jgi:hypothetical protein
MDTKRKQEIVREVNGLTYNNNPTLAINAVMDLLDYIAALEKVNTRLRAVMVMASDYDAMTPAEFADTYCVGAKAPPYSDVAKKLRAALED